MNTHDILFKLETPDRLKELTNQLMRRSPNWCVMSDARLTFPCHVGVDEDYSLQISTLAEHVQVDGVWRRADTTAKQLQSPTAVRTASIVTV